MALRDKLTAAGPKKLLTIDGGGIRGVIALEILEKLEEVLGQRASDRAGFRLADCFDLIAGTSTGAIIAAGLALRKSVGEIRDFYLESGPEMFEVPSRVWWELGVA